MPAWGPFSSPGHVRVVRRASAKRTKVTKKKLKRKANPSSPATKSSMPPRLKPSGATVLHGMHWLARRRKTAPGSSVKPARSRQRSAFNSSNRLKGRRAAMTARYARIMGRRSASGSTRHYWTYCDCGRPPRARKNICGLECRLGGPGKAPCINHGLCDHTGRPYLCSEGGKFRSRGDCMAAMLSECLRTYMFYPCGRGVPRL